MKPWLRTIWENGALTSKEIFNNFFVADLTLYKVAGPMPFTKKSIFYMFNVWEATIEDLSFHLWSHDRSFKVNVSQSFQQCNAICVVHNTTYFIPIHKKFS